MVRYRVLMLLTANVKLAAAVSDGRRALRGCFVAAYKSFFTFGHIGRHRLDHIPDSFVGRTCEIAPPVRISDIRRSIKDASKTVGWMESVLRAGGCKT